MTTLDAVARKMAEASAEELAAAELVRMARERGLSLTGPGGLLKQLGLIERAQRTRPKTVLTETTGPVPIEVPRDRDGSFEP